MSLKATPLKIYFNVLLLPAWFLAQVCTESQLILLLNTVSVIKKKKQPLCPPPKWKNIFLLKTRYLFCCSCVNSCLLPSNSSLLASCSSLSLLRWGGREALQWDILEQLFAIPLFKAPLPPAAERVLWSRVPFQGCKSHLLARLGGKPFDLWPSADPKPPSILLQSFTGFRTSKWPFA